MGSEEKQTSKMARLGEMALDGAMRLIATVIFLGGVAAAMLGAFYVLALPFSIIERKLILQEEWKPNIELRGRKNEIDTDIAVQMARLSPGDSVLRKELDGLKSESDAVLARSKKRIEQINPYTIFWEDRSVSWENHKGCEQAGKEFNELKKRIGFVSNKIEDAKLVEKFRVWRINEMAKAAQKAQPNQTQRQYQRR